MKTLLPTDGCPISRRAMLAGTAAGLLVRPARAAAEPQTVKVGLLPFGSVQWEIETLRRNGFDAAAGIRVEPVSLASTEAARIAFLSGSVDAIVGDLLFAARIRAEGHAVRFLPQSSTEGELVVPATSPVRAIADLRHRTIGVAGGPLDKNWLFLRAAALRQANLDLARDATVIYGAAPLLAAKLESGELECGLLYWSQGARLAAKGYRRVSSTEEVLRSLGAKGQVAVGGYLFGAGIGRATLLGFRKAVRAAEHLLADEPEAWNPIRALMKAPDEATFAALKDGYVRGIPRKGRAAEIADARAFIAIVRSIGGGELLGPVADLPDDLYVDPDLYG